MAGNSAEAGRSVTSKVIAILMAFRDGTTLSLTEIAEVTGLPLSTVHRLTTELAASDMLERTSDRSFQVGFRLQAMGAPAGRNADLRRLACPVMEDLSAATRADVRLGVLADVRVAYIQKFAGDEPVPPFSASSRLPGHATAMGKAIFVLSTPDSRPRDRVRPARVHPVHTDQPEAAPARPFRIRGSGVAVSRWELKVGLSSVAVPIFGRGGHVWPGAGDGDARPVRRLADAAGGADSGGSGLSRDLATISVNCCTLSGAGTGSLSPHHPSRRPAQSALVRKDSFSRDADRLRTSAGSRG